MRLPLSTGIVCKTRKLIAICTLTALSTLASIATPSAPDDNEQSLQDCLGKQSNKQTQITACENFLTNSNVRENNNSANVGNQADRLNSQLKLIELYTSTGNFIKAKQLVSELNARPHRTFSSTQAINFLRRKGILAYRQGELPLALSTFEDAVDLAQRRNNETLLAKTLSDVGTARLAMMQYPEALEAYQQSLALKESTASLRSIAVTLNNIGTVYRKMSDWIQAEKYYRRTLNIYSQENLPAQLAHTQENLGIIRLQNENAEKAISVFKESLDYFQKNNNQHGTLRLVILLAEAYLSLEDLSQARAFLADAESIELALGVSDQSTSLKLNLGRLLSLEGSYQQAEAVLIAGLTDAREKQDKENEIQLLGALVDNATKFEQWQKAFQFQQQLTTTTLGTYQTNFAELLAKNRALFEYEQQRKEIHLLNKDNEIKKLQLSNKQSQFSLLVLSISLVSLVAMILIGWLWRKRKQLKNQLKENIEFHHQQVKELGASNSSLKLAFGQFNQAIMIFNNRNALTFSNQAAHRLFDASEGIFKELHLEKLVSAENAEFWQLWQSEEEIEQRLLRQVKLSFNKREFCHDLIVSTIQREEPLLVIIICSNSESNNRIPINAILPEASFHQLLVDLMLSSLQTWETCTQSTRIELAEQSGIWRVSIDDGRLRTRSLDKYLAIKTLPKKPRWREVVRTAHFVLAECQLNPASKQILEQKLETVTQHVRAEALI